MRSARWRAGLGAGAIVSTAILTVVAIPSAMDAGLDDPLFYGSIALGFAIAYPFTFLVNRRLIARGEGTRVGAPAPLASP